MRVVVTCGPSYEPVDQVRRLTNFSTGTLGIRLANALSAAGHDVLCLKGQAATCADPLELGHLAHFGTNDELQAQLEAIEARESIGAFFHVAALCDFRIVSISGDSDSADTGLPKLSSRAGGWTLRLEPARKVISGLRALFPAARIVGWKYELNGDRASAMAKGLCQMEDNHTDACVVNGRAYGEGFGWCTREGPAVHHAGPSELIEALIQWLACAQAR